MAHNQLASQLLQTQQLPQLLFLKQQQRVLFLLLLYTCLGLVQPAAAFAQLALDFAQFFLELVYFYLQAQKSLRVFFFVLSLGSLQL
jgi:hypothetical protein